jgi:glycerophosphoryl diester phosphodiesterase
METPAIEWISHRGYKASAVENTAAAFRAAVERGFKTLETDLHVTADDRIVLAHDPDFARLAGDGRPVAGLTSGEVRKLRFADGSAPLFFTDFIDEFGGPGLTWVFDVKPATAAKSLRLLAAWADAAGRRRDLVERALYVVWSRGDEAMLKAKLPGARCFAKERECYRAGLAVLAGVAGFGGIKAGKIYSLTPRLGRRELFRPEIVAAYHDRGARVLAFLPETEADTRRAIACGCDLILTNGDIINGATIHEAP